MTIQPQQAQPIAQRTPKGNGLEVALAWTFTVLSLGYMLPWAIAATRHKSNTLAVAMVNLFLGWTFIGWVVALVMACGSEQAAAPQIIVMNSVTAAGHLVAPVVTPPAQAGPPAGWYASPDGVGQRYWDGAVWTDATA